MRRHARWFRLSSPARCTRWCPRRAGWRGSVRRPPRCRRRTRWRSDRNAVPRSASEALRLQSGPVTPAGHGMSGGAGSRARLDRAQRRRRGNGVQHEPGVHRLVAEKQVVMDLHDDEASRGEGLPSSGRQDVLAVTRSPGRQPRRFPDVGQLRSGQRGLAEARPTLAIGIGGFRLRSQRGRHEEQDGVVHLDAVRIELARDDEGVRFTCGLSKVQW